jgi:hypothetical protein
MSWKHGELGCSLEMLGGLISLMVTAYAKKAVTINGIKYGKGTMQAMQQPGNVYWKAEIKGAGPAVIVGNFDDKETAMKKVIEKYTELVVSPLQSGL